MASYPSHHHSQSRQISEYLQPTNGIRDAKLKKGIAPKNHLRENMLHLKEIARQKKEKQLMEEEKRKSASNLFKIERFQKVHSKLADPEYIEKITSPRTDYKPNDMNYSNMTIPSGYRPETTCSIVEGNSKTLSNHLPGKGRDFLKKGISTERYKKKMLENKKQRMNFEYELDHPESVVPDYMKARGMSPRMDNDMNNYNNKKTNDNQSSHEFNQNMYRETLKAPVPKASEMNRLAPRKAIDHVRENFKQNIISKPPTSDSKATNPRQALEARYVKGKVPQYLVHRKEKWAKEQEKIRANMPDPDAPPGSRLMPEEERKATLETLAEQEKDIRAALMKIPLTADTPSMIKRREALERRLTEISNAKLLFHRQKVYIKIDA